MADPLILTLAFDAATQARLDALRRAHFPDRGYRLPAHLTLFHKLPGAELAAIDSHLTARAARTAPLALQVTRVLDFNPGAAYRMESAALAALRAELAAHWSDWLSPQDRQGFRPHVTIQNKVGRDESVYPALAAAFTPHAVTGTGLRLWHYRGGPWEPAGRYDFGGIA